MAVQLTGRKSTCCAMLWTASEEAHVAKGDVRLPFCDGMGDSLSGYGRGEPSSLVGGHLSLFRY